MTRFRLVVLVFSFHDFDAVRGFDSHGPLHTPSKHLGMAPQAMGGVHFEKADTTMNNNNERLSFNMDHVENLKTDLAHEFAELIDAKNHIALYDAIHECHDPELYGMLIAITVMTDQNDERVEFRAEIREAAYDHVANYLVGKLTDLEIERLEAEVERLKAELALSKEAAVVSKD